MPATDLRVTIIAPRKERCGIADYADELAKSIAPFVFSCQVIEPSDYRQGQADIVHIQHQYFLYGGVAPWKNHFPKFLKSVKEPVVMTVHEFETDDGPPLVQSVIRWTNKKQFHHQSILKLITHTQLDKDRLVATGLEASKVSVIRHGIPEIGSLLDKLEAKREFGLEGKIVVTILGFVSAKKRHSVAIESLSQLPDDYALLIAGGQHPDDLSPYVTNLKDYIGQLGLTRRVILTGYLSEEKLKSALIATDIFLAPFRDTSGSGSLAHALSVSGPIVASDIQPHREIVSDTPDALTLFELNDPQELVAAVQGLMNSPAEFSKSSSAASEYAAKHSYSNMAKETAELFKSVLAETK